MPFFFDMDIFTDQKGKKQEFCVLLSPGFMLTSSPFVLFIFEWIVQHNLCVFLLLLHYIIELNTSETSFYQLQKSNFRWSRQIT